MISVGHADEAVWQDVDDGHLKLSKEHGCHRKDPEVMAEVTINHQKTDKR